jgi:hypothetical protein
LAKLRTAVEERITLYEWERLCRAHSGGRYVTGEAVIDAYWQTLLSGLEWDTYEDRKRAFHVFDRKHHRHRWLNLVPPPWRTWAVKFLFFAFFLLVDVLERFIWGYVGRDFASSGLASIGRRMVVTEKGYIGMAAGGDLRPGDQVALLEGGRVPLVLRPIGPFHNFVGSCYIHGIMKGEAFKARECKEIWLL